MGSFWAETYNSFRATGGYVAVILGLALGVWAVIVPTPFQVDIRWVLGIFVVGYVVSATFLDLAKRSLSNADPIPKVILARKVSEELLLLLAPSQSFGNNSVVSVYHQDNDFEIFIGVGRVNTIQQDGRIQVLILDRIGRDDLWERICRPEVSLLATLIVKPTIPFDTYRPQVAE
jgi:hypothetical protein